MSRGFVKEDDQEEVPMVPQRAYLPDGVTNFVTKPGMDLLLIERKQLINERDNLGTTNENDKRISANYINARLQLLDNRIAIARVINLNEQPTDEIRFGATVTLRSEASDTIQVFQITGVDEAKSSKGKISFLSPMANALINKKTGDKVVLKQAGKDASFVIMNISYKE
jgi:transcription elongation factor GreB